MVACDQFTSDKTYWNNLSDYVGDSPSTLRLILPECFLGCDEENRRRRILDTADEYLKSGLFKELNTYVYVKRKFTNGVVRNGLIAELDLEQYDYEHKKFNINDYDPAQSPTVIATEGTVVSRLPARVKIRRESKIELPHIMVLVDDPQNRLFKAVCADLGEKLYDFTLNAGGGEIEGYAVENPQTVDLAADSLILESHLRFGKELFALVGDGNHSLAAAKQCYEIAKAEGDPNAELLRYALCEIVNVYDEGIVFEPIHRALFDTDPIALQEKLMSAAQKDFNVKAEFTCGGKSYEYLVPENPIAVYEFVQSVAEGYERDGCKVDYIHGDDVIQRLGSRDDCIGIKMPPISKDGFTEYVLWNGVLPKKTFSMGDAEQKRYYLEARLLRKNV